MLTFRFITIGRGKKFVMNEIYYAYFIRLIAYIILSTYHNSLTAIS